MSPRSLLAHPLALALCTLGCVRLTPYEDVRKSLPADEFLKINDQWVHVERAGSGEPVLLIHGFGGSTYCWRHLAPALAEHFEVISIDLNGFGYTQRPEAEHAYSLLGQVELLISVMDALDINTAHLVGHSYGADIALVAASLYRDRASSLTLIDGGVVAGERATGIPVILLPLAQWIIRNFVLDEGTIRKSLEDAVFDPAIVTDEMVREYLARLMVEGLARTVRGFSSNQSLNAPEIDFDALTQPTLIIWGDHDPVFASERAIYLGASLPNASVLFLDQTGHLPMEERPEALSQAILNFLETALAPHVIP